MGYCSREAYEQCLHNSICGKLEDAFYLEGSECAAFNRKVQKSNEVKADYGPDDREFMQKWNRCVYQFNRERLTSYRQSCFCNVEDRG